MIDDQQLDDIGHLISEDINNWDHSFVHNAIISHPLNQSSQDQEDSQISKYNAFSEFLITEWNRRYDLRPRSRPGRPPKSPTINEPQIKSVETQTTNIHPLNQTTETSLIDKIVLTTFNVERELERVRILVPLSELSKNPGYKNQVSKWI